MQNPFKCTRPNITCPCCPKASPPPPPPFFPFCLQTANPRAPDPNPCEPCNCRQASAPPTPKSSNPCNACPPGHICSPSCSSTCKPCTVKPCEHCYLKPEMKTCCCNGDNTKYTTPCYQQKGFQIPSCDVNMNNNLRSRPQLREQGCNSTDYNESTTTQINEKCLNVNMDNSMSGPPFRVYVNDVEEVHRAPSDAYNQEEYYIAVVPHPSYAYEPAEMRPQSLVRARYDNFYNNYNVDEMAQRRQNDAFRMGNCKMCQYPSSLKYFGTTMDGKCPVMNNYYAPGYEYATVNIGNAPARILVPAKPKRRCATFQDGYYPKCYYVPVFEPNC